VNPGDLMLFLVRVHGHMRYTRFHDRFS